MRAVRPADALNADWLDPLHGPGYAFWSGIGSTVVPLWIGLMIYFAPTRCQELGCRKRARGRHPLHGWPVCERHLEDAERIAEGLKDGR